MAEEKQVQETPVTPSEPELTKEELLARKYADDTEEKAEQSDAPDDNGNYTEDQIKSFQERRKNGERLTVEQAKALKEWELQKKTETVDFIVRGLNDTFQKHYEFKEDNVEFTVKIKAPSSLDQAKIVGIRDRLLQGQSASVPYYDFVWTLGLARLQVSGIDLPKELSNPEDIYNTDWLYTIEDDFENWFRGFKY